MSSDANTAAELLAGARTSMYESLRVLDDGYRVDQVAQLRTDARAAQMAFMSHDQLPWGVLVPLALVQPARYAVQELIQVCRSFMEATFWDEKVAEVKKAIIGLLPLVNLILEGLEIAADTDMASLLKRFRSESTLVTRWQLACTLRRLIVQAEYDELDYARRVKASPDAPHALIINEVNPYADAVVARVAGCTQLLDQFMRGVDIALKIMSQPLTESSWERAADLMERQAAQTSAVETAVGNLLGYIAERRPPFDFLKPVR